MHTLQKLIYILDISNVEAGEIMFRRVEASELELLI